MVTLDRWKITNQACRFGIKWDILLIWINDWFVVSLLNWNISDDISIETRVDNKKNENIIERQR